MAIGRLQNPADNYKINHSIILYIANELLFRAKSYLSRNYTSDSISTACAAWNDIFRTQIELDKLRFRPSQISSIFSLGQSTLWLFCEFSRRRSVPIRSPEIRNGPRCPNETNKTNRLVIELHRCFCPSTVTPAALYV